MSYCNDGPQHVLVVRIIALSGKCVAKGLRLCENRRSWEKDTTLKLGKRGAKHLDLELR